MLFEKLQSDMKAAMKAGEKQKLSVIRMLMSEIKNARIDKGEDLDEAAEVKIVTTYAKKRKEAMENAEKLGRDDLVAKEQAELDVTMSYLPAQLSDDDLKGIVQKHIAEVGGDDPKKAFGMIMKAVMADVGAQADGKRVSGIIKELLG